MPMRNFKNAHSVATFKNANGVFETVVSSQFGETERVIVSRTYEEARLQHERMLRNL